MLDAYVIEEIKRRDCERGETRDERPSIELPCPSSPGPNPGRPPRTMDRGRGVVIIDYS